MPLNIQLGMITITSNPATMPTPITVRPDYSSATYDAFQESIMYTGLVATIFAAFRAVAELNDPILSQAKWPNHYGTSELPWGRPANGETGEREERCVDEGDVLRWTTAIKEMAKSRMSFLKYYAETAIAIASGIKSAMESTIRTGRVTIPAYIGLPGSQVVRVNCSMSNSSEIFLQVRAVDHSATIVDEDSSGFSIAGDGSAASYDVSWLVMG
jgi:hypothetical protein